MTLERAHLKPARPGLIVSDPEHGNLPLPPEGREVGLSSYWFRRLEDGDVVRMDSSERAAKPPPRKVPEKP